MAHLVVIIDASTTDRHRATVGLPQIGVVLRFRFYSKQCSLSEHCSFCCSFSSSHTWLVMDPEVNEGDSDGSHKHRNVLVC